jgi:hypothetical protein
MTAPPRLMAAPEKQLAEKTIQQNRHKKKFL